MQCISQNNNYLPGEFISSSSLFVNIAQDLHVSVVLVGDDLLLFVLAVGLNKLDLLQNWTELETSTAELSNDTGGRDRLGQTTTSQSSDGRCYVRVTNSLSIYHSQHHHQVHTFIIVVQLTQIIVYVSHKIFYFYKIF